MAAQNNKRPFKPTDEAIIEHYLRNIVHGKPPPSDDVLINVADVYGECGTWEKLCELLETDTLYFFKTLSPPSRNDSRVCRVAKEGTWKGEQRAKVIKDVNGKPIGSRGNFSFMTKTKKDCKWVMHEYRLEGDNINVLCRIRKKGRNGSTAAIDEEALSQKMMELENVIRGGGGGEGGHREP